MATSDSQSEYLDLDAERLEHLVEVVRGTVGEKWVERKLKQAQAVRKGQFRELARKARPKHPVVNWLIDYLQWMSNTDRKKEAKLLPSVVKLGNLGVGIEIARGLDNFDRVLKRLKDPREFEAAAFEIEVAANISNACWQVEFLEEGSQRTPDLKASKNGYRDLYVECKSRDRVTPRDRKNQNFFSELGGKIGQQLSNRSLSYHIEAVWRRDPEPRDAREFERLLQEICSIHDTGACGRLVQAKSRDSAFTLSWMRLTRPGEKTRAKGVSFRALNGPFDWATASSNVLQTEKEAATFWNPAFLGLKSLEMPDRTKGAIHAFKSAVGQLPESGPGAIWIRLPDAPWAPEQGDPYMQTVELLRGELAGSQNRRVNDLYIMARIIRKLDDHESRRQGVSYTPVLHHLKHGDPRTKLELEGPPE